MNQLYSEACERNKGPIAAKLEILLKDCQSVFEVGSGSGQHAAFFAQKFPHLNWTPSDLRENHPSIEAYRRQVAVANLQTPRAYEVGVHGHLPGSFDAVFTANSFQIMSEQQVFELIRQVGKGLGPGGIFIIYSPFCYGGVHTSSSNEQFDRALRARDPSMGVRDFQVIEQKALQAGLALLCDQAMPANNRLLCFQRRPL